jgi:hypothetical protein
MKIRRLKDGDPQASIGTILGVTIYQGEDDRLYYKDKTGAIISVMDNQATDFTQVQADIITNAAAIALNTATRENIAPTGSYEVTEIKSLSEANIVGMNGADVALVAGIAGTSLEFISAVLIYDFDTAAYTGGGDITIKYTSGATVSTTVAAADGFGSATDEVFSMAALNAAGGYTMPSGTGFAITNATGAFVDPGTAAGVARIHITYKVHTTGL